MTITTRADSRFVPSQWEPALLCNDLSHWLDVSLELALHDPYGKPDCIWNQHSTFSIWGTVFQKLVSRKLRHLCDILSADRHWKICLKIFITLDLALERSFLVSSISLCGNLCIVNDICNFFIWDQLGMQSVWNKTPGLFLDLRPANEKWRYFVTKSLIGWEQT